MNQKQLDKIVQEKIDRCLEVLGGKAGEYVGDFGDRLANFKDAANALGITPLEALLGMKIKHSISIRDLSRKLYEIKDWDKLRDTINILRHEKIVDEINYDFLLDALIVDEFGIPPTEDEPNPEVTYNGNGLEKTYGGPDTKQITLFDYLQEIAEENLLEERDRLNRIRELSNKQLEEHEAGECEGKNHD